ncbi:MAG: heme-binding Shp domain-containing protein [Eubacteriales bacterium]|nr:heme-binding Shp domain-containing protein [Eubacteriales bacterium]
MNRYLRKSENYLLLGFITVALGILAAFFTTFQTWAMDAGTYLVTVTPSYTDPETGKIEDPGNNEAIGQGMTQKLCGPQGLLEVDASGNMYLTVRYYLSQFVSDVSFEERNGGSYSVCSYQKMQTKAPVDGASNLDDKYGYTDYRIPIQSLNSVFRGKAYIEPMGRNVVYFFQASGPVAGSGDFVTSIQTELPEKSEIEEELDTADEGLETDWRSEEELQEPEERENVVSNRQNESHSYVQSDENSTVNGSGNADDPVTGIPVKPGTVDTDRTDNEKASKLVNDNEDYHLETVYDLSAVPMKEARKLTEPMLEAATGITITVGDLSKPSAAGVEVKKDSSKNTNKSVMLVLLGISVILIIRLAAAVLLAHRGAGQAANNSGRDEIEKRRNQE